MYDSRYYITGNNCGTQINPIISGFAKTGVIKPFVCWTGEQGNNFKNVLTQSNNDCVMYVLIPQNSLNGNNLEYNSHTKWFEGVAMEVDDMSKNIELLNSFLNLEVDWDNEGALPLPTSIISKMRGIIFFLHHQPDIFPTARDSIQFEYEKDDGDYLEFELFEDRLKMFKMAPNGDTNTSFIPLDISTINKAVDEFYG